MKSSPKVNYRKYLKLGRIELNKELTLESGTKIVTSRYPMINEEGKKIGAFAVFKDITEVVRLSRGNYKFNRNTNNVRSNYSI